MAGYQMNHRYWSRNDSTKAAKITVDNFDGIIWGKMKAHVGV